MHHANVPTNIRYRVYNVEHRTVTILNGLTVIDIDGKQATRYEHFRGINSSFEKNLGVWVKQEW